jgi:hypothetical protein
MAPKTKALKIGDSSRVFRTLYATGDVTPKWAYQEHYDPAKRQQQERNGVPVWTVHCVSLGHGDLSVTVPAEKEPQLAPETPISLTGLVVGASPSGQLWFSADSVATA